MKKLLFAFSILLLAITACTDKPVALPQDQLTVIVDSTATLQKSSAPQPFLVGFNGGVYEMRVYTITNRKKVSGVFGSKISGTIACPFCTTSNLIDVTRFGMCGSLCMGKVTNVKTGLKVNCSTRFYQKLPNGQTWLPNDTNNYARFGYPYKTILNL